MPNQEPASAWIFGNSLLRVGTEGLFHPYLKTFVPPFLRIRQTAPGFSEDVWPSVLHVQSTERLWLWSATFGDRLTTISENWTILKLQNLPVLVLPSPPPKKTPQTCSLGSLPYFHKLPYFQPLIRFGMSVRVINKLHHLQGIKRFCSLKYVHIVCVCMLRRHGGVHISYIDTAHLD